MFGSIVLEVLIGIVLVYLLLSLVCSTVQEAIASACNWRGHMLQDAIRRLFPQPRDTSARGKPTGAGAEAASPGAPHADAANVEPPTDGTKQIHQQPSIGDPPDWTEEIYQHPLIDALHNKSGRLPSYIANATFADALVDLLVHGKPPDASPKMSTEQAKRGALDASLSGMPHALPLTPTDRTLRLDASPQTSAEQRNERSEGLLGDRQYALPLTPTDRLLRLLAALGQGQGQGVPGLKLEGKTRATLNLLMERARQRVGGSTPEASARILDAFKEEVSRWYENTMRRATGWYRRKSQIAQFAIAAVAVIATNADTLMISRQLARDPKAREAAVNTAASVLEKRAEREDAPSSTPASDPKQSAESDAATSPTAGSDTEKPAEPGAATSSTAARESVKDAVTDLHSTLAQAQIAIGWPDPEFVRLKGKADGWWWWGKCVGLAMSICAVALGAPFWFQVLEKLVKVRSSGNRIAGESDASPSAAPSAPPQGAPDGMAPGTVTFALGGPDAAATSVVAVTSSAALEKLDESYWSNFAERWKGRGGKGLGGPEEPFDREIAVFLARMSALAYEQPWTIRGRLAALGVATADDEHFQFFEAKGTQAFAFKLEDDVIVAYRGTEPSKIDDLTADARFALTKHKLYAGRVHTGFADAIDRIFDEIDKWIEKHVVNPKGRVLLTGHSLGAALATLHFDRRTHDGNKDVARHELVTFGSPRVGDVEFCNAFQRRLGVAKAGDPRVTRVLRFVNNRDLVTRVAPRSMRFEHVGAECYIDSEGRVHVGAEGASKWSDFTLLVVDGLLEFKSALKKPIGDHAMDLYVRRLENWTNWSA